ncbi:MAG: flavodoxin [Planctomycetia bacterium]|nr:flavodoxin [Planctomycetia bacterium]
MKKEKLASEKILVAYYSWSGSTRAAAKMIQAECGGEIFEIVPVRPYPSDYQKCVEQAKKECRSDFHPDLKETLANVGKYEVIFVGSPNWWGTVAPPVATFLTAYDFNGKILVPFITHGGGGMQNCLRDVKRMCPGVNIPQTGVFSGYSIKNEQRKIVELVQSVLFY